MASDLIDYAVQAGVCEITLNNPPANGYSYELMRELDEAVLRARFDPEVFVLLLSGAGEKFFCAGADIAGLAEMDQDFKYQFCLHANETMLRIEHTPKLVIAALNGHTVGGGLEIALACDLRIARKDGGKIGLPEVALGVLPGTGGTQRLARTLGKARALELMVSGRTMTMAEAQAMGLVHEALEEEDFRAAARAYARAYCPPQKAAHAVGLIKRSVQTGSEIPLEAGLALERELQARLFASRDAEEGLKAFVEKRTARFQGR